MSNAYEIDFDELIRKFRDSAEECGPVDAELLQTLHGAPWSCDKVRTRELAPFAARLALGFGIDRSAWTERLVVNAVSSVASLALELTGYDEEALECRGAHDLRNAKAALELAKARLLPFFQRADEAGEAAAAAVEQATACRLLATRTSELATDTEDRPMIRINNPHYIDPIVRATTWAVEGEAMADRCDALAKELNRYADSLAESPELACYICCASLLDSCDQLEKLRRQELPPAVALKLAVFRAGQAVLAAVKICAPKDEMGDRILTAGAAAGIQAYPLAACSTAVDEAN